MSLVIGTLLSFTLLDGIWRFVALIPLALLEIAEITLWLRLRKLRSITGAEAMVGARGKAVSDCRPTGQVRVKGQLWRAEALEPVAAGDDVEVAGLRGNVLEVRPVELHKPSARVVSGR